MPIREHEIADRLTAAAVHLSEPQFGVESVARRIRRRRTRLIMIASMSTAAMAVVAVTVLNGIGTRNHPAGLQTPLPAPVWLPIRISIDGQTALVTRPSHPPRFTALVRPVVPITAQVTVPPGVRVRKLWLGIVTADVAAGGPHGPTGWAAILLRTTKPLSSGKRTFHLRWIGAESLRPGRKVYLIAYWVTGRSAPEPIIASLVLRRD